MNKTFVGILFFTACGATILASALSVSALTITPTTNGTDLASALGGSGLTITGVTINTGAAVQFGTYTGFTSPPSPSVMAW